MTRADIEREIRRRADHYLARKHLAVNYYRIRRRVAYPLPVRRIDLPAMPVPGIPNYPWATWMTWELEERIGCLGWAAAWFDDRAAREAVIRDLDALAAWPAYRQYPQPDLSLGHAGRTLWSAYDRWPWLGPDLRGRIEEAFRRIVADALPYSDEKHGAFASREDVLALPEPHTVLANIPFIGTTAIALAARAVNHPALETLDRRLHALIGAMLALRTHGHSEGVAYDGYILDFAMTWLQALPEADRAPVLDHPRFADFLDQSLFLSAPGNPANVAELSDVEPVEMPFHITAHARTHALRPSARLAGYLAGCPVEALKADALAALHPVADNLRAASPPSGAHDAHYAVALRSGGNPDDLAVVMAASSSPMSHIQRDTGTLVIGAQGRWIVSDPGYQQYMKKREREFTLGSAAHNTPVINGHGQSDKLKAGRPVLKRLASGLFGAEMDLTACYPETMNLTAVTRTVYLSGKDLVVVADRVAGQTVESIAYHWHGHPDAAWWVADNWARICLDDVTLRMTSPQTILTSANVDRIPGSRGQLTLCARADVRSPVIWWVFALGEDPAEVKPGEDGGGISVGGREFRV